MTQLRIGTSGWSYPHWRGAFYPRDLPRTRELEYASRTFDSLEINRSFYSLLSPAACKAWYEATPEGFVFALKGSRFITHNKKLRDAALPLANFFASGPLLLEEKLGPIVWQLPASMRYDEERLGSFLGLLPRSTRAAARLARGHDGRPKHGTHTRVKEDRELRHVLEARHESFLTPACAALLREQGVALAVTDSPTWPYAEEPTTSFMYVRLHGSAALYASSYDDEEIERWSGRVLAWQQGRDPQGARRIGPRPRKHARQDVYVYFDNDAGGRAAEDAQRLARRVQERARYRKGA